MSQKDDPAKGPSLFAKVKRMAGERRAESDRKSAVRRAAEMKEVERQLAARKAVPKAPQPNEADDETSPEEESA